MKQAELVNELRSFDLQSRGKMRGENALAGFLAYYFEHLDIPQAHEEPDAPRYYDWHIEQSLPQLLVGAVETLRTSTDEAIVAFRTRYEQEAEHAFPDLIAGWGELIEAVLTTGMLARLLATVMGQDWLVERIQQVLGAERHLIELRAYQFAERVYRRGLCEVIGATPEPGWSGSFGLTELRIFRAAGRRLLTLVRPGDRAEQSVTFICADDGSLALGMGVQSVYTDLTTALEMIDEVIARWPTDWVGQLIALAPNEHITLG